MEVCYLGQSLDVSLEGLFFLELITIDLSRSALELMFAWELKAASLL